MLFNFLWIPVNANHSEIPILWKIADLKKTTTTPNYEDVICPSLCCAVLSAFDPPAAVRKAAENTRLPAHSRRLLRKRGPTFYNASEYSLDD